MNNELSSEKQNIYTSDYLQELFKDKKSIQLSGIHFKHVGNLLDKEIALVKENLFKFEKTAVSTDNGSVREGRIVSKQEKIFLPVKENPNYNFVGRILGPRGYTAKQLEQKLDCKIMIRGRGSMRDQNKEEQNRNKPNWEHLNEDLHVLINISDYENRVDEKMNTIKDAVTSFIQEGLNTPESLDTLKQMQLMELSILNENDRMQQQQQRQQTIFQQSAASYQLPPLMNSNFLKLPFLPTVYDPFTDLSQLINLQSQTQQDPLQVVSLGQPWSALSAPIMPLDNSLSTENILSLSNDQNNSALLSLFNQPPTINYVNYSIAGPLKLRTDQRTHPYSRTQ